MDNDWRSSVGNDRSSVASSFSRKDSTSFSECENGYGGDFWQAGGLVEWS